MKTLHTTLGPRQADQLGVILPHEHIFVDLGPIEEENWKAAQPGPVVEKMAPQLGQARAAGVSALVECTPVGVGRRVEMAPRKIYNIKKGTYHSHTLSRDAVVLIVENRDTGEANSERIPLQEGQRWELIRQIQVFWEG
jgi:hypothetical protein